MIASCAPDFPKLLVSLDLPLLTMLGKLALARPDAVANVGARDMAADLGRAGLLTVSGLAR